MYHYVIQYCFYLHCLGAELLQLVHGTRKQDGINLMQEVILNGKALQKFQSMIICQGVSAQIAEELCYGNSISVLPTAQYQTDIIYEGDDGTYDIS